MFIVFLNATSLFLLVSQLALQLRFFLCLLSKCLVEESLQSLIWLDLNIHVFNRRQYWAGGPNGITYQSNEGAPFFERVSGGHRTPSKSTPETNLTIILWIRIKCVKKNTFSIFIVTNVKLHYPHWWWLALQSPCPQGIHATLPASVDLGSRTFCIHPHIVVASAGNRRVLLFWENITTIFFKWYVKTFQMI